MHRRINLKNGVKLEHVTGKVRSSVPREIVPRATDKSEPSSIEGSKVEPSFEKISLRSLSTEELDSGILLFHRIPRISGIVEFQDSGNGGEDIGFEME